MSCALTIGAVRNQTKTVTRRAANTWGSLKPGDHLTLIEKGMGLKKGERQVVLAEVEIIDVRVENLGLVTEPGELAREGFPSFTPADFMAMWLRTHGGDYRGMDGLWPCRRIEWRYLP